MHGHDVMTKTMIESLVNAKSSPERYRLGMGGLGMGRGHNEHSPETDIG